MNEQYEEEGFLLARGVPFLFITGYQSDSLDRRFAKVPILQKPVDTVTLEKVLPWRRVAVWSTTLLLLALAVGVLAVPGSVPGFVVPSGGMAGI